MPEVNSAVTPTGLLGHDGSGPGTVTPAAARTLLNVEDGANVTDTANVTAAGALMDSEVTNLADVKAFDPADYATAAQGATADSALPATGAGLVEQLTGHIETAENKTYVLDQSAAYAYTINTLIIKSASGAVTAKLTIDGVDVTGISAVSVSSTEATGTASAANAVSVGNTVALVLSSNSSALDVAFTVKSTR